MPHKTCLGCGAEIPTGFEKYCRRCRGKESLAPKPTEPEPEYKPFSQPLRDMGYYKMMGVPYCKECGRANRALSPAERIRLHRMRKG